jgi:acyl-CoA synthetase (AMP-forming)/AMP-acid ligase II
MKIQYKSVGDIIFKNSVKYCKKPSYIFLSDGEKSEDVLTYKDLEEKSVNIASNIQHAVKKGDRVLILSPPGLDYILGFLGCLITGAIPVPLYPPDSRSLDRLLNIARDCDAKIALTNESVITRYSVPNSSLSDNNEQTRTSHGKQMELFKSIELFDTRELTMNTNAKYNHMPVNGSDTAFLQYTSGSTSQPKGVMVTHDNLLYNSALIKKYFDHKDSECKVSWIPPFHDMGLIGDILQTIFSGMTMVFMSPASFLKKPVRWLWAISNYKSLGPITSGAPNFAFDWCTKLVTESQLDDLDLSGWKVAYNGSEPVKPSTIQEFNKKFEKCGLKKETLSPVYGLAEGTLMVSPPEFDKPSVMGCFDQEKIKQNKAQLRTTKKNNCIIYPSSGLVIPEQKTIIVDLESKLPCDVGEIGEIWVKGQSIAKGYWKNPVETENTFNGRLSNTNEGPFLRTGDLGFIHDGRIYITGRIKDLIIIRGENYYPQDIEQLVENSHEFIRNGCGAAISINVNDNEELVIIYELKRKNYHNVHLEEIKDKIRSALFQKFGLQPHDIVLIEPSTFPKTSSGKLQRQKSKKLYLDKQLAQIKELAHDIT